MLNLKTIFDVVESPVEVRLVSRDSLSPDLLEQADPFFDEIQATPDAGAPHDSASRLSNPERGLDWPKDVAVLADFVLLLSVDDLPPAPFDFGPGATVVDAAMFLRWLQADVRRGPKGPRAIYGAVQNDLRRLHELSMSGRYNTCSQVK